MYEDIANIIKKYECKGDFTYPTLSENVLSIAESMLDVKIPEQYSWFLKTYGHGGISGIETLGIGKNGKLIFVEETKKYRTYGLSHNFIVIENCDEWIYCLDSTNGNVVMWSQGQKNNDYVYETFIEYLNDRVYDAIENI